MKTRVKIEIAVLAVIVLVAAALVLVPENALDLLQDPVVKAFSPEPVPEEIIEPTQPITIPTEPPQPPVTEPPATEPPIPEETEPQPTQPGDEPAVEEPPQEEGPRELAAKRYFAYDLRDETYLTLQGDGDEKLYPASITKLLTAHVLLMHMDPKDMVEVGDALLLVKEDSSVADLKAEDVLTVEQLVAAMMLPSGNDAAQVAAVAVGRKLGGTELDPQQAAAVFVEQMNAQAQALGMTNSHFENADGWHHENHYTTMNDLIALCKAVLGNEVILRYTSSPRELVDMGERDLSWRNTNLLLHESMPTYIPSTIGLKTGTTGAAGGCLITAFFETDRILLIGVFQSSGHNLDRYLDTVDIYNSLKI